jgi:N-acetylated-alpha-linked acidic dipeptidase
MAEAEALPFDFRSLYKTVNDYVKDLMNQTEQMRETTSVENEVIRSNSYALANDPVKKIKAPVAKEEVPYLDFSPLQNALSELKKTTDAVAQLQDKYSKNGLDQSTLNKVLYQAEQRLLSETGLPRRDWYKHTLYAPGFYTGYGVKTIPGVREAIEQRNWKEAKQQINIVSDAILRLSVYLDQSLK